MRAAHVDCPRYRRGTGRPVASWHAGIHAPTVPRAIGASLVVLALAAGISFGFVLQRGGIDLPVSALASGAAAVDASAPASAPVASGPTSQPTPVASADPGASSSPEPAASPTVSQPPAITLPPTASAAPTPSPKPKPSASGGPSASRLAVLKPCSGQKGCYIYTIRAGDNLFSIAHWFGVSLDTIRAWNPAVQHGIHPGDQIRIPTPTR